MSKVGGYSSYDPRDYLGDRAMTLLYVAGLGQVKLGQVKLGQVQDRLGQVRLGQNRLGQVQDRLGQDR